MPSCSLAGREPRSKWLRIVNAPLLLVELKDSRGEGSFITKQQDQPLVTELSGEDLEKTGGGKDNTQHSFHFQCISKQTV